MSGTRSPSPKAPVTDALIVSHGQPANTAVGEACLRALAEAVGRLMPDRIVRSATLAAPGVLEAALAACEHPPLVYPVFMTDGWFTRKALAGRLKGSGADQMAPYGLHPELPVHAAEMLRSHAAAAGWAISDCTILVSAHGSASGSTAADSTAAFVQALQQLLPARDYRIGYLEQPPHLMDTARLCGPRTLELPFFAGCGGHVVRDVPEALEAAGFSGISLPALGQAPFAASLIAQAIQTRDQGRIAA